MMLSFEEWQEFHDYWARSLAAARDPERVVRLIDEQFGEAAQRLAHQTLALAAALDDPGSPPAIPDDPQASRWCAWCGRTRPPDGLQDQSMGGPPSWSCTDADLDSCLTTHDQRVTQWREVAFPTAEMPYPHMVERRASDLFDTANARSLLDSADAAQIALQSWRALNPQPAARQAADQPPRPAPDQAAAAPPPPVPAPVDWPAVHWQHTMRNPANRAHTLGGLRSRHPRAKDAPAVIAHRDAASRS